MIVITANEAFTSIKAVTAMIQLASGILGAVAATLAFGAVHLEVAPANDRLGENPAVSKTGGFITDTVERTGKGDRQEVPVAGRASGSLTIGFVLPGSSGSSVLMRVPVRQVATSGQPLRTDKASVPRRMIACEPPVSVLTPIARQLGPARCVT